MQRYPLKLFFFAALSLFHCNAFHASTPLKNPARAGHCTATTILWGIRSEDFAEDNSFDVEGARQKLESLVGGGGGEEEERPTRHSSSNSRGHARRDPSPAATDIFRSLDSIQLPPAPPLTSIDRERRQAEMELLSELSDGDDVLLDLWTLWFQERGPKAAARLTKADELSSQPYTWGEAEVMLRELIQEYGVHWVEPVNRLATLYYMQGKLSEAKVLCKTVLAVKPWHFGALSGIVMVYAGLHQVDQARHWAAHRLPTFAPVGPNRRREHWVTKAENDAENALLKAEQRLQDGFGRKDDHVTGKKIFKTFDTFDKDAWQ